MYSEDSRFKDRLGRKKARKGSPWDHLSLGELARWLLRECWARPLGGKRVPGLPETSLVAVSKPVQGDRKGGRRGPFPLTHFFQGRNLEIKEKGQRSLESRCRGREAPRKGRHARTGQGLSPGGEEELPDVRETSLSKHTL